MDDLSVNTLIKSITLAFTLRQFFELKVTLSKDSAIRHCENRRGRDHCDQ